MSFSQERILRKLENDRERSIDYYNFICKNDGGTSSASVVTMPIHLEKSVEKESYENKFKIINNWGKINYIYEDLYDLTDESDIATKELESDPEIMQMIELGQKEILENKKVPWRKGFK